MTATGELELAQLYDQLARYQWWMRRWSRAQPGERLAMRKQLAPGRDELAGVEQLNTWLWNLATPDQAPRVLDLGAGFGDTLLCWAADHDGEYIGLGLSPYQVRRATEQAASLGLTDRCRFVRQEFDAPLPGQFDLIVAVETLFHARDLGNTLAHVAAALVPGGDLVLVEDMARDASVAATAAGQELLSRWSTPRLHTRSDYHGGLRDAGLELEHEFDLTGQLVFAEEGGHDGRRSRRRRRLRRLRCCLPGKRHVVDAFLGGLAMEELQQRGDLEYRAMRARRPIRTPNR